MVESLSDFVNQIKYELFNLNISEKSAFLEARELVCYAAGIDRKDFLRLKNEKIDSFIYPLQELMEQRKAGMPVAYIIGEWDFYGRTFFIDNNVLIPRDDSAAVIELLLSRLITKKGVGAPLRILDLCTGSGCLGITAVLELGDNTECVLVDNSRGAIQIASKNIVLHYLSAAAQTAIVDVFSPIPKDMGSFDAIICNPPYIRTQDLSLLDSSVTKYEPIGALDGGGDGLMFFREIASKWSAVLKPNGILCFEVGMGQAESVVEILKQNAFEISGILRDLSGIKRAVCAVLH